MDKEQKANLLTDIVANSKAIEGAIGRAVRHALLEHKRAGNPVAIWQDGKVVWVAPEDIVLPPEPREETKNS